MKQAKQMKPNYELTAEEEKYIYKFGLKGVAKECHKIATMLCNCSMGKIKYYEGCIILKNGFIINHSWNFYNNKVIDLIALNKNSVLHKNIKEYVGYNIPFETVRGVFKSMVFKLFNQERVWELEGKLWKENGG